MTEILILLLFGLGGVFDGARDAIEIQLAFAGAFRFMPDTGFKRWLLGTEHEVTRFRIWKVVDIPLNGWHVCKTACYLCLALATAWSGGNWWIIGAGWLIVRPIAQNTCGWSCLYSRFTFRMF